MTRTATCSCGHLRAETPDDPGAVVACHCTECQRRTGSVVSVSAYFPRDQVTLTGESRAFSRPTDSGKGMTQHFCPTCGTTLFWIGDAKPDYIGIAVGAFADANFPAPLRSVWEQSHHKWLGLPEGIKRFDKGRPAGSPQT